MIYVWTFVSAALVAALVTFVVGHYSARLGLVDAPNARSLHQKVTPRSGGIGVLAGTGAGFSVLLAAGALPITAVGIWLMLAALLVAAVSLVDDLRSISPLQRLVVHIAASLAPVVAGLSPAALTLPGLVIDWPSVVAVIFTVLFVGWFINLYNFMDGMDGFAGGMTLFGFGTLAVLGLLQGDAVFGASALCVAAGALGFLVFNFPPARIFLGDLGSASLGFIAAVFALWADQRGVAPLWVSVMVFGPFVLDATVTLVRRLRNGEKVWEAHRSHYYQRLVQAGWSHRRTVLAEYLLMVLASGSAILTVWLAPAAQWVLIVMWLAAYAGAAFWVQRHVRIPTKSATDSD